MKNLLISSLACAALVMGHAYAHGGTYRGPGDVVPPNPGGGGAPKTPGPGGPSTPGPGGPSTPGPSGPSTPGPSGPSTGGPGGPAARGPSTGPRGLTLEADLTGWQFWWEFNKDPFIRLKEAIQTGGPTTGGDIIYVGESKRAESKDVLRPSAAEKKEILPALKRAMDGTDNRDITSSCMVAMAKIGMDHETFEIVPIFKERLKSKDQEIRETAALAMGISQMEASVDSLLVPLVKDAQAGRSLVDRSEVDARTRSFAAYALGLVAWANPKVETKRKCFETLKGILDDEKISDRNVRVAAINGIRLIRPDPAKGEEEQKLLNECLATLTGYYEKKLGQGEQLIQSHVPPAIAQLLGRSKENGKYKDMFAAELTGEVKRADNIYQSAVLALGQMCLSGEEVKEEGKYSKLIQKYFEAGKDPQARNFCLIALAMIGGEDNRNFLLTALDKGKQASEKPWAAVSLGVYAFNKNQAGGANAATDPSILSALRAAFNEARNPETIGAMAIGLGLAKGVDAQNEMLEKLSKMKHQDELAGYLCVGLALMGAQSSLEDIRNIVRTSVRRPELLKHAAIALGKLGDKDVTNILQQHLAEDDQNLGKLSAIASALGFIGDRRSIEPLKKMLFDESLTPLSRAFAAVALGGVADKEMLPWNSKIAVGMNYRASVETLTNRSSGILDIL
jgi:HEAT repeat protein